MFHFWRRSGRSVLIVSQNHTASLFDSEFLRHPDIRLLTAFPDDGAFEIAHRERPSLIIGELAQPGHAGLAFCHDLAKSTVTRSIPLILVVAPELWDAASRTRADVVLGKPIDRREFFDAVRRFVPLPGRQTRRLNVNLRFIFRTEDQVAQAFSRDLSTKGAFLKTDRILPLGTRLDLRFCLPGVYEEVECRGVVRCTSSTRSTGELGGFGLEFEGLSEEQLDLLETFIEHQGCRSILSR